jgi:IS5 family transposase
MERVVPWLALCALIEPFYPKPGSGRPPIGAGRLLRIYFLQHWFNLSAPAVEEGFTIRRRLAALSGSTSVANRCRTRPRCRFRHLLEEHDLGRRLFDEVQRHLAAKGLKVATDTIVDATIINAPSSRMPTRRAIPRCIRPRRAISGISG